MSVTSDPKDATAKAAGGSAAEPPRERARRKRQSGVRSEDRDFVNALARGLMVLEAFGDTGDVWISGMEVANRVGLPKPTTSRLLQALTAAGYLHYSKNRRQYRLGAAVLGLGFAAREPFSLSELVRPHLMDLADTFNVHVSLSVRSGLNVVMLEVQHSRNTLMTLQLEVGSRIRLADTATGHALISAMPETDLPGLFQDLKERHSENWDEISASIEAGRQEVAARGYTTASTSWYTDVIGIAAPLIFPGGAPIYALACGAPARHLPAGKQRIIGQRLAAITREIEMKLGQVDTTIAADPQS